MKVPRSTAPNVLSRGGTFGNMKSGLGVEEFGGSIIAARIAHLTIAPVYISGEASPNTAFSGADLLNLGDTGPRWHRFCWLKEERKPNAPASIVLLTIIKRRQFSRVLSVPHIVARRRPDLRCPSMDVQPEIFLRTSTL